MKYSFLSRLALPGLMSLILLAPAIARADMFEISATFNPGGLKGIGSFQTNGTCIICMSEGTLTNFTFTVDDDTFTESSTSAIVFDRALNIFLELGLIGADDPTDNLGFPGGVVNNLDLLDEDGNLLSTPYTVTPAPEPSSPVFLAGGIGLLVFGLTRRFAKKSATH